MATGFFLLAGSASAATLSISPTSGSYEVGKSFTVTVSAASPDASVNAFSGTIKYPKELLEYSGSSASGSVINQWLPPGTTGPSVRTSDGVINFEGISLVGYRGSNGKLFSVTFRVKKTGTADISFTSGSVLANDGLGTDVLTSSGRASLTLIPAVIVQPKPIPVPPDVTVPDQGVIEIPVQQATGPTVTERALQDLVAQMTMLMTFMKFVLGAVMALAIILIILAIYIIHLAVFTRRRSSVRDRV